MRVELGGGTGGIYNPDPSSRSQPVSKDELVELAQLASTSGRGSDAYARLEAHIQERIVPGSPAAKIFDEIVERLFYR